MAVAGDFTVDGGTPGADYSFASDVLTILSDTPMIIGMATPGAPTTQRIVIGDGTPSLTANITLNGVSINVSAAPNTCALEVDGDSLNLTLAGESTLKSGENRAGLQLNHGGSLTITQASGTATLEAVGGNCGAGIGTGGSGTGNGGSIDIEGGVVTARVDGASGNGIGAGRNGGVLIGDITISGGEVRASAPNTWGDGIGSHFASQEGDIVISGGTVEAHAAYYGSGIGGSIDGNIKISGSTTEVEAYGGGNGAGIGGALSGDLVISGGTITARGGNVNQRSDGIGLDGSSSASRVVISNATVTATGVGGAGGGAGIYGRTVIIKNGDIEARGNGGYAGIGSAWDGIPDSGVGTITINGGRIRAYGSKDNGNCGAGIGGSFYDYTDVVAITINGGSIKAEGGTYGNSGAPGIGRSTEVFDSVGLTTINGGTIIAEGGGNSPDIDTQFFGYGGPLVINGGSLWADELNPAPVNNATPTPQPVFANTLTLGASSAAPSAPVSAAAIDGVACATTPDANTGVYGIRDVWTNVASAVCFWLPANPAVPPAESFAGVGLAVEVASVSTPFELSWARSEAAQTQTLLAGDYLGTVIPSGSGVVAQGGNVTVSFTVAMDTTSGTVELEAGSDTQTLSGGSWSTDNKTFSIAYTNLLRQTNYTIALSGFKTGVLKTAVPANSAHSFTTGESWSASITLASKNFGTVSAGYGEITPQVFTITNTGTATLTDLAATLSGTDASAFEIAVPFSFTSLPSGASATIGIRPKTGLAAQVLAYTAQLNITCGSVPTTLVSATLEVTVKDTPPTPAPSPTPTPPIPSPDSTGSGVAGGDFNTANTALPSTADTAAIPLAAAALLAVCGLAALARSTRPTRPMNKR
jgi:hypothetical protein